MALVTVGIIDGTQLLKIVPRVCVCVCVCVLALVTHRHWQPHTPKIPWGLNWDVKVKLSILTRSLSSSSSSHCPSVVVLGQCLNLPESCSRTLTEEVKLQLQSAVSEPLSEALPGLQLDSGSDWEHLLCSCGFLFWLQTQTGVAAMTSSTWDRAPIRQITQRRTRVRRTEERKRRQEEEEEAGGRRGGRRSDAGWWQVCCQHAGRGEKRAASRGGDTTSPATPALTTHTHTHTHTHTGILWRNLGIGQHLLTFTHNTNYPRKPHKKKPKNVNLGVFLWLRVTHARVCARTAALSLMPAVTQLVCCSGLVFLRGSLMFHLI